MNVDALNAHEIIHYGELGMLNGTATPALVEALRIMAAEDVEIAEREASEQAHDEGAEEGRAEVAKDIQEPLQSIAGICEQAAEQHERGTITAKQAIEELAKIRQRVREIAKAAGCDGCD